jgi:hypothetical protein
VTSLVRDMARHAHWMGAASCVLLGAGCAAGGAASGAALALAFGLAMFGLGCSESHEPLRADAAIDKDADIDAGYWEPCCMDGVISSCFCPAGAACNYGWFTTCEDGSCVDPSSMCPEEVDGHWEPCCEDGIVTTCFCPAEWICNYGLFVDCGDGTCSYGEACPAVP